MGGQRGPDDDNPSSKRNLHSLFEDDADTEVQSRRQCVDCRVFAPPTSLNYSLISAKCGGRLSRVPGPTGTTYAWRCPTCSLKHRSSGGA